MLELINVYKRSMGIEPIDLKAAKGIVLGLLAKPGMGKSTLLGLIDGSVACDGGKILINEHDITHLPQGKRVRKRYVARSYATPQHLPEQTVWENLAILPTFSKAVAERALEGCHLADEMHTATKLLSPVQSKWLELARALICDPHVVLLDEILCGLDPSQQLAMNSAIDDLAANGSTVVCAERHFSPLDKVAVEVLVLSRHGLVAGGRPSDVREADIVQMEFQGMLS